MSYLKKETISDKSIKNKTNKKDVNLNKKSDSNSIMGAPRKELKFFRELDLKKYLTKINITYFFIFLVDIIMVILMARRNVVNYVSIFDEEIFVSKTRYLLFGRNYINLVITAFFYIYTCFVTKFFLNLKNKKKFLILLFIILSLVNMLLFFFFTKKVY